MNEHLCLLGNSFVGKTTFWLTFKNQKYTPSETATIGITNFIHTIRENNQNLSLVVSYF